MTITGKVPHRQSYFYVVCEVCSEDVEMFPSPFEVTKAQVTTMKQTPCGCAKIPKWSEDQWWIKVVRECMNRKENIKFYGWDGEYRGSKTRLKLKNLDNGCSWSPVIHKFLHSKQGDPESGVKKRTSKRTAVLFDVEAKIKETLKKEGGVFLKFPDGYKNNRSKFEWVCSEGHSCISEYSNFISLGRRCYDCNSSGFNSKLSGWIYIVRWAGKHCSYLKVGVTNSKVIDRIKAQKSKTELDYEILHTFHHDSGQAVWDCEKLIKQSVQTSVCPKELLPDGYTETTNDTPEVLAQMLNIIKENL